MHSLSSRVRVWVGGWSGFGKTLGLTAMLGAFAQSGVASDGEYEAILATLVQAGPETAMEQLIEGLPDLADDSADLSWQQQRRAQLRVLLDNDG